MDKMIEVTKDEYTYPFSKGILARSMGITNLPMDEIYRMVREIYSDLEDEGVGSVPSNEIKKMVMEKLLERGYEKEERFYRVSREIRYLETPLLIMIGGGPGVGKSTISAELGHRLSVNRIIGSDTIREIMRGMISPNLIPTLHESTFMTDKRVKAPFVKSPLIYGFDQQASLVNEGIKAVIKRGIKEGLNTIINGVHIVPGYLDVDQDSCFLFQYVLETPDVDELKDRFKSRSEGSHRNPSRYIDNIEKIRKIP